MAWPPPVAPAPPPGGPSVCSHMLPLSPTNDDPAEEAATERRTR